MNSTIFLITEARFHASYLMAEWIKVFDQLPSFGGIALREDLPTQALSSLRSKLHEEFYASHFLSATAIERFREAYPHFNQTDIAMIKLFGVPAYPVSSYPRTTFLGKNLNTHDAWKWLSEVTKTSELPFVFIFLDQLLNPWWLEMTNNSIVNSHSAILPYARGMYAIENIAITQDADSFTQSAGATVHYIDTGIDTGPIIATERLFDPFRYDSIWEVKAASFQKAFSLLTRTALSLLETHVIPEGIPAPKQLRGPNFNSRDFTYEARRNAEEGYLKMKMEACQLAIT